MPNRPSPKTKNTSYINHNKIQTIFQGLEATKRQDTNKLQLTKTEQRKVERAPDIDIHPNIFHPFVQLLRKLLTTS